MTLTIRILLAVLFVESLIIGGWNAIAPKSFYRDVPTVDLTPPFSEHYARDFGWTLLGVALLLGWAALKPKSHYVIPAAGVYAVFAMPHFFFHLEHLAGASTVEAVALTAGNAVVAALTLTVIVLAVVRDRRGAHAKEHWPSATSRR